MNVRWDATMSLTDMINEGVRRAYNHPDNKLRASIVADPAFDRKNTRDNTPAVIHMEVVPGEELEISRRREGRRLGEQGRAHDAQSVGFDRRLDPRNGAGDGRGLVPAGHARHRHRRHRRESRWCSRRNRCSSRSTSTRFARAARRTGSKRCDWRFSTRSTRSASARRDSAASRPCSTSRSRTIRRTPRRCRSRSFRTAPPRVTRISCSTAPARRSSIRPISSCGRSSPIRRRADSRRVNLDALTREDVAAWQPGERLLLSGKMLTGRDAAHKRLSQLHRSGQAAARRPRLQESRHLLRRSGRSGEGRSRRTGRPDDGDAHGQVHRDDARPHRPDRDGRQGRARPRSGRGHPQAQGGVSDGGRRRGVSRVEGDPRRAASSRSATSAWKRSTSSK